MLKRPNTRGPRERDVRGRRRESRGKEEERKGERERVHPCVSPRRPVGVKEQYTSRRQKA